VKQVKPDSKEEDAGLYDLQEDYIKHSKRPSRFSTKTDLLVGNAVCKDKRSDLLRKIALIQGKKVKTEWFAGEPDIIPEYVATSYLNMARYGPCSEVKLPTFKKKIMTGAEGTEDRGPLITWLEDLATRLTTYDTDSSGKYDYIKTFDPVFCKVVRGCTEAAITKLHKPLPKKEKYNHFKRG